jgi:hypothetical protein
MSNAPHPVHTAKGNCRVVAQSHRTKRTSGNDERGGYLIAPSDYRPLRFDLLTSDNSLVILTNVALLQAFSMEASYCEAVGSMRTLSKRACPNRPFLCAFQPRTAQVRRNGHDFAPYMRRTHSSDANAN